VSLSVSRSLWTSVHVGTVRITDAARHLSVTTPLWLVPVRTAGPTADRGRDAVRVRTGSLSGRDRDEGRRQRRRARPSGGGGQVS
jgi:hypothetical protein